MVPGGLRQRFPQMFVSGLGNVASALALAAGMLGGRESDPDSVALGVFEPRELADLEVDAVLGELLLRAEARGAGLIDVFGGLWKGAELLGQGGMVIAEGGGADLASHYVERDGLDRARLDVQFRGGVNTRHREPIP